MHFIRRIIDYYRDPEYFRQLYRLAAPIAIQNLLLASLNMVGSIMVGRLGDDAIAAVGLAEKVFFLFTLILFGLGSGCAIFTAQLWGKKDTANLRRVLGLCIALGLVIGIIFVVLSVTWPAFILRIFSNDVNMLAVGSKYLRLYALSFLFFAVTSGYASVLRSVGEVRLPLVVTVSALALNITLTYGMIFGKLGLPAYGLQGAALAVVISRAVEAVALVFAIYWIKSPVAASLRELFTFNLEYVGKVLKPVLPVIANETLWSLGITTYSIVYGHIGKEAFAAMKIAGDVDNLALFLFFGISGATATLVGNRIGAGEKETAQRYGGRSIGLVAAVGMVIGIIILLVRQPVLSLYNVSEATLFNTYRVLTVLGLMLWLRVQNAILIVGILRSGGDTRFCLFLDGIIIWIVGVPMALLGGFVLHLPVYWVYFMVMAEEFTKWVLGLIRFNSRKWIHDVTEAVNAN